MPKSKKDATAIVQSKLPDDGQVLRRLARAEQDVLGYGYDVYACPERVGTYHIHKLSTAPMLSEDNGAHYVVTPTGCTCPDFDTARGNLCKHRLAVMILKEMQQ